jgi:hypothetical protein
MKKQNKHIKAQIKCEIMILQLIASEKIQKTGQRKSKSAKTSIWRSSSESSIRNFKLSCSNLWI